MQKYINVDDLINELSASCMPIHEKGISGILGDESCIADIILAQPSADVAEVRHGKWSDKMVSYRAPSDIDEHGNLHFGFRCSECGAVLNKTKFCGNCGARMDGDKNFLKEVKVILYFYAKNQQKKLSRFGDQKMLEILELIRAILKGEDNADNSERP